MCADYEDTGDSQPLCFVNFTSLKNFISLDHYFFIFFWFRVVFVHLVPCVALVVLNYLLCAALRRADQRRRR